MSIVERASDIADLLVPANSGLFIQIDNDGNPRAVSLADIIKNAPPNTPVIQTPSNGNIGVTTTPTITASAFSLSFPNGDTFIASQWQIATDVNFTNIVENATLGGVTSFNVITPLTYATAYYVRVRYEDSDNAWSKWSNIINFVTMAVPHGSQNISVSGTFTVPAGVTSIKATTVAGGGGGGGWNSNGDTYRPGSGASGGYSIDTFAVTPGEVLSINVGAGGLHAETWYNGNPWYGPGSTGSTTAGTGGGSSVYRGGTLLSSASGGSGGGQGFAGIGGSPNGVNGQYAYAMNDYPALPGGVNGTGYGSGGASPGGQAQGMPAPGDGGRGNVLLEW